MRVTSLFLTLISLLSVSTEVQASYCYRVFLSGKPESQSVQLSERALLRRERLGIETDSLDLEVSPLYIEQLVEAGLRVVCCSRWLNTVVVTTTDNKPVSSRLWNKWDFVTKVETVKSLSARLSPRREKFCDIETEEGVLNKARLAEDCSVPLEEINALQPLYEAGYRGKNMLVAVLDAGFTRIDSYDWLIDHVVGERDMYQPVSGESEVYSADTHGSNCLSVMASHQSHGVWGTAQEAEYYLIRTEVSELEMPLEEDLWVAGAELADSLGADLINSSLGYHTFDSGYPSHSTEELCHETTVISQGAKVASQKGILVCNAAGNDGYYDWCYVGFPADVYEVLTVGGYDLNGQAASFTSRGFLTPFVKPDVSARAKGCYIVNAHSANGDALSNGSGTSFATPLVTGACASLWSAVPELTPEQLREVVQLSASHYQSPDSITGYGMPDFGIALQLARQLYPQSIETINADESTMEHTGIYDMMGIRYDCGKGLPTKKLLIEGHRKKILTSF